MTILSILTGDIVDSSDLSAAELDRTMGALDAAAAEIAGWGVGTLGFARRGGDGWQLALAPAPLALRAALYCQAVVRRLDERRETRIAVAEGAGQLPADGNPNAGSGPAFVDSGRLLEAMDRHARFAHADGGPMAAAFRLAGRIAEGWTQAQARALCEALPPETGPRAEAAQRLGISREAVNQALWSASFRALEDALQHMELRMEPPKEATP